MAQITKVSMISLMENDLPAAMAFYKKLGFPLTFHVENQWAEFDMHGVKLFLYYINEQLPERYTGLALEVDDLEDFYATMKDQGIEFITEPKHVDYAIVASIKDPGNNIVGLVQPTPERIRAMMEEKNKDQDCCFADEQCCADDKACC
jgi:predicted enzyme related to lactoylglutathione lyase